MLMYYFIKELNTRVINKEYLFIFYSKACTKKWRDHAVWSSLKGSSDLPFLEINTVWWF